MVIKIEFKTSIKSALDLYKLRIGITPAIYQRGEVWPEEKKKLLIDSILRGIDIPKLYFFKSDDGKFEIVDGNQRFGTISGFFSEEFTTLDGRLFSELTEEEKKRMENHEFTVVIIEDASLDDLSDLFLRLQLGVPTNSGEKLNAINSKMREFVKSLSETRFMQTVSIPKRRFAKEQVCAQICVNSLRSFLINGFQDARFEDLKDMYKSNSDFDENSKEAKNIKKIFDKLYEIFGSDSVNIRNRAAIVSLFFLVEELMVKKELNEGEIKEFYLTFLLELEKEVSLGIDAKRRNLINYYNKVVQGADHKTSIEFRHKLLKEFYNTYKKNKKII